VYLPASQRSINKMLYNVKKGVEVAIRSGGREEITSEIRSQRIISHVHEFVKWELVRNGVDPAKIYPPLDAKQPEIEMVGFLKAKSQDVTVLPDLPRPGTVAEGVLTGSVDSIGKRIMQRSVSINVRSQLSSIAKNFDTMYERTFAEALNLHLRTPTLVMGEIYVVPTKAYDPDLMKDKKVGWREDLPIKYIPAFRELNGRVSARGEPFKYERLALLIVNFQIDPPEVISSADNLKRLNRKQIAKVSLQGTDVKNFIPDLLRVYRRRHGSLRPLQ
jgi:hypothetical protein